MVQHFFFAVVYFTSPAVYFNQPTPNTHNKMGRKWIHSDFLDILLKYAQHVGRDITKVNMLMFGK